VLNVSQLRRGSTTQRRRKMKGSREVALREILFFQATARAFCFLPPWTVEEQPACLVVRDHNGQALAYVYFEEEPGQAPGRSTRSLAG
jgi:hypothetical protein